MILEELASATLGLMLGLSLAAPPGPMNAVIATHTVTRSRLAGFLVGCGAMTVDATFLAIVYATHAALTLSSILVAMLSLLGAVVMFYFAYRTSLVLRKSDLIESNGSSGKERRSYLTGLAIGYSNPYQIFWWLTAGLAFIDRFGLVLIGGFFVGILIWIAAFPLGLDYAKKRFSKTYHVVLIFSMIVLTIFAAVLLVQGMLTILS